MQDKQFKQFERDPQVKILSRSLCDQLKQDCEDNKQTVLGIRQWLFPIRNHPQHIINYAVYESQHARDWQILRVALKGFTTREKLYILRKRYREFSERLNNHGTCTQLIQIDNYINALIRGGQLDSNGRVMR